MEREWEEGIRTGLKELDEGKGIPFEKAFKELGV